MAYDVLTQQYPHETIRSLMQGDKDSVNILKNRLTASKAIIDACMASPATMIPWYAALSQEEKNKIQAWAAKVNDVLNFLVNTAGF